MFCPEPVWLPSPCFIYLAPVFMRSDVVLCLSAVSSTDSRRYPGWRDVVTVAGRSGFVGNSSPNEEKLGVANKQHRTLTKSDWMWPVYGPCVGSVMILCYICGQMCTGCVLVLILSVPVLICNLVLIL